MKGLTFAVVTTLLVVGAVAMLPQAVSAQQVVTKTKPLPSGGTPVSFTLNTGSSSVVVLEVLTDNTATTGDCVTFDFDSLTINGRPYRPGNFPFTDIGNGPNDTGIIRPLLNRSLNNERIPLEKYSQLVLTFENGGCTNAVILKVTIGVLGSGASLN